MGEIIALIDDNRFPELLIGINIKPGPRERFFLQKLVESAVNATELLIVWVIYAKTKP